MRLLITGADGFIGRHAVRAARDRGWQVSGIDYRRSYSAGDVRALHSIYEDVVLHLAAYSSLAGFSNDLAANYDNNVNSFAWILELARKARARVIYASSSAVYGDGDICDPRRPNSEEGILPVPASHYARSKLINEMMAASFADLGVNSLGLRIFDAYGPGDEAKPADRQAPPTWMQAAKREGRPAIIYDDGFQSKDFIHVSDVVEIIMRLIESDATGIVNVGTGVTTSFNRLAELIMCEVAYQPIPNLASYQLRTQADTAQLLSIIGEYKFKTVEEGI